MEPVCPASSDSVVGLTVTATAGTVMLQLALLLGSATDVAVIVALPDAAARTNPSVTETTAAFDVDHLTAVFVVPVTTALSCVVWPSCRLVGHAKAT